MNATRIYEKLNEINQLLGNAPSWGLWSHSSKGWHKAKWSQNIPRRWLGFCSHTAHNRDVLSEQPNGNDNPPCCRPTKSAGIKGGGVEFDVMMSCAAAAVLIFAVDVFPRGEEVEALAFIVLFWFSFRCTSSASCKRRLGCLGRRERIFLKGVLPALFKDKRPVNEWCLV